MDKKPEFDLDQDPTVLVDQLNAALNEETDKWAAAGITPQSATPDLLYIACCLDTVVHLLIENDLIPQHDMDIKLKLNMLSTLRGLRVDMLRNKLSASGIVGPNGKRL